LIERAVAEDAAVLEQLAVGVVAFEQLSDLRELGIVTAQAPLRDLATLENLEDYVLSFEHPTGHLAEHA
jgi:hypothetical protein